MKSSNIAKRPPATTPSPTNVDMEKFIGGAPDATPSLQPVEKRSGLKRGKREQISHTLPPDLLDKLDNTASEMGLTRAGLINLALSEFLKNK